MILLHILQHQLIPLLDPLPPILPEIPRHRYLQHPRRQLQIHNNLIEIDEVTLHHQTLRAIPHEILFDLAHPHHRIIEHLPEELPLLGVDELVVAVLELLVHADVLYVQAGVVLEPFEVGALVG